MKNEIKVDETMVKIEFDEKDFAEFAKEGSELYRDLENLKDEKASVMKDYANSIASLELKIKSISQKIHDGYEMKKEPCYRVNDYRRQTVYFFLAYEIEKASLTDFMKGDSFFDINGNIETERMLEMFERDGVKPIKVRRLRASEYHTQMAMFDDYESVDFNKPDESGFEAPPTIVGGAIIVDNPNDAKLASDEEPEKIERNDKELRKLLEILRDETERIDKAPSLKTISNYTDEEYEAVSLWATAIHLSLANGEVTIPEKPAFLPR